MKKFKIAIDITPTIDQNSKRGVGFYTKYLVNALQKEVKTNPDYKNYDIKLITNSKSNTSNFNLVHYPYFDPFKLTLPIRKIPTVVTVHDLIPRQFKKNYPVGLRGEINWLIQKHRLKNTDFIITDSHSSKYQIKKLTNYPVDRIYTIYLSSLPTYKPIKNKKLLETTKQKYKLPNKFVLYVGDINWNKNIPRLVKSCLSLKYPLIIVGASATQKKVIEHPWNKDLIWLQKTAKKHKGIVLTGFINNQDLVNIFNLATIYCQPSIAEGFGLPILDAMSCGCPVAYSLRSSVAEISSYHGQPFNPYKISSIKNALKKLWTSQPLRQKFAKEGLKYSSTFSWKQTAIQTLSVYKLALLKNEK